MAGDDSDTSTPGTDRVPEPQGRIAGVPYDFRKPTVSRLASRWWNPDDRRLFTPKTFGAGWDINLYWLTHPARYVSRRAGSPH